MATGLNHTRAFCPDDTSPYNTVSWSEREAEIKDATGKVVFRQQRFRVPESWSDLATKVVAQKYAHGPLDSPDRESGVESIISRVVGTIAEWGRQDGYFDSDQSCGAFRDDLAYLCLHQYGAFNSPVWFNVGVMSERSEGYCWDRKLRYDPKVIVGDRWVGGVREPHEGEHRPQGSACFIQSVADDMRDIMRLAASEAMLFKRGSGTGTDLSTLRSTKERLSGGGRPSGPVSFFKVYDTVAGIVKSGGVCLDYDQPVYTAKGCIPARALAESGGEFVVLSYSKRMGRVAAKRARAWFGGYKPGVEVITDKGTFRVSHDHPFMLSSGQCVRAESLKTGQSLLRTATSVNHHGYARVGLRDGRKGRGFFHQMVASDVCGWATSGKIIHHKDENKLNNCPSNLELMTQSEHAAIHGKGNAFYTDGCPGERNGMHCTSEFWSDKERSSAYRAKKSVELIDRGNAREMQRAARRRAMMNLGYELINEGYDISTFDAYLEARKKVGRRSGVGKPKQLGYFEKYFGSYEDFLVALSAENHRVVEVRPIGDIGVVSVEVIDPEPDDKRDWSEHNYGIAPIGSEDQPNSVVFVLNTRRAARMQTLKCWHPDILDFIEAKVRAERLAKALVACGFDGSMEGEVYSSIPFQNTNTSIRVTNEFMVRATSPADDTVAPAWPLKAVTTGEIVETVDARELLRRTAEATWECGDPGIQYEDTIQEWHTCPNTAPINSSNPCSEYMFIDDSACNLASINLMKFRRDDGTFDAEGLAAACRVFLIAQEILVDRVSYPTEKIAENSHRFRPLGLGYANLGALIMTSGLAYDSNEGRALAAAVTSVMNGAALLASAEIAEKRGAYDGFAENREHHLRVAEMHSDAAYSVCRSATTGSEVEVIAAFGLSLHNAALTKAYKNGFRNSQVTLLAPTGTIAFIMDCDTTGVEPDIALVKYKTLAGGGMLKLVNRLVPMTLKTLGYFDGSDRTQPDQIAAITNYVEEHGTIVGAPYFNHDHLPVFATAFGDPNIHWKGHVEMMAAVQPFLSGAISKCVSGDTLLTTENGLVRIEDLYDDEPEDSFSPLGWSVDSGTGLENASEFYYGGNRQVFEVELEDGRRIRGTAPHRLRTADDSGLGWKTTTELREGDFVALKRGSELWGRDTHIPEFSLSPPYGCQKVIERPRVLTPSLAWLIGALTADGHITRSSYTVGLTKNSPGVLHQAATIIEQYFGLEVADVVDSRNGVTGIQVASKSLMEWLDAFGFSKQRIPSRILTAPRDVVLAYLSGLYLDGYISQSVLISQKHRSLIQDLQVVWDNLGVSTYINENIVDGTDYPVLHVSSHCREKAAGLIDWIEHHKRDAAASLRDGEDRRPFPIGRLALTERIREANRTQEFRSVLDPRTREITRRTYESVAMSLDVDVEDESAAYDYVRVRSVKPAGVVPVYDISVPTLHRFVANGIVNHNTVNMPASATVEDVIDCYMLGWKRGLKALAIFRDGSKGVQPVRTSDTSAEVDKLATLAAVIPDRALAEEMLARRDQPMIPSAPAVAERVKLPETRAGRTGKFRVAGFDGYVTANHYQDGRVGELFVTAGKDGSTVAGLLDWAATCFSLALQYGCPLEKMVEHSLGRRFEPHDLAHSSIPDAVAKWLRREFLEHIVEPNDQPHTESDDSSALPVASTTGKTCHACGNLVFPNGSKDCYACPSCGNTQGACGG